MSRNRVSPYHRFPNRFLLIIAPLVSPIRCSGFPCSVGPIGFIGSTARMATVESHILRLKVRWVSAVDRENRLDTKERKWCCRREGGRHARSLYRLVRPWASTRSGCPKLCRRRHELSSFFFVVGPLFDSEDARIQPG